MSVPVIPPIGSGAEMSVTQLAQMQLQSSQSANAPQYAADVVKPSGVDGASGGPGFVDTMLDSVYTEIGKMSSELPKTTAASPVDVAKKEMASGLEATSPMRTTDLASNESTAVEGLSKAFDHAMFMAMVNQVVSGVSDTSRTLIRQS